MRRLVRALLFWRRQKDSASFLALLIRAQEIQENDGSMSAAFRAGLRVGLAHPELARAVVKEEEL
ncbi:hypothetical protein SEA_LITTLETOKYO_64 [Arthrobacter phage LittleTokyo]|nr:hypothetical protein SEA_LITTLETOKYO_64 [Arthrobacter phage LittleTokyo]